MGQGQIRVPNKGRWAHDNISDVTMAAILDAAAPPSWMLLVHSIYGKANHRLPNTSPNMLQLWYLFYPTPVLRLLDAKQLFQDGQRNQQPSSARGRAFKNISLGASLMNSLILLQTDSILLHNAQEARDTIVPKSASFIVSRSPTVTQIRR